MVLLYLESKDMLSLLINGILLETFWLQDTLMLLLLSIQRIFSFKEEEVRCKMKFQETLNNFVVNLYFVGINNSPLSLSEFLSIDALVSASPMRKKRSETEFKCIERLILNDNKFEGEFPKEINSMNEGCLKEIDISGNKFSSISLEKSVSKCVLKTSNDSNTIDCSKKTFSESCKCDEVVSSENTILYIGIGVGIFLLLVSLISIILFIKLRKKKKSSASSLPPESKKSGSKRGSKRGSIAMNAFNPIGDRIQNRNEYADVNNYRVNENRNYQNIGLVARNDGDGEYQNLQLRTMSVGGQNGNYQNIGLNVADGGYGNGNIEAQNNSANNGNYQNIGLNVADGGYANGNLETRSDLDSKGYARLELKEEDEE